MLFAVLVASQTKDFTRYVNPFIGTGGHGHTFPGATVPFGMVQLSPDTRIDNWDGSSGYHYSDDIIYGFSHTHLSGTGIPDGCDILFMPTVDSTQKFGTPIEYKQGTYDGFSSRFSHADEVAEPGYYSVRINEGKLLVELSATTRVGIHRYTFPKSTMAGIYLDLLWRDMTIDRDVKVIGDRRIEGFRRSSSWAKNQTVYFVAEFSKPFKGYGTGRPSRLKDDNDGIFFGFNAKEGEQILLKVAISYVSIEGARKNLETELSHWDFDKVRADAKAAWNNELSKIEVSGGTPDQMTTFYTALYHTMIHPNIFQDVDGRYRGHDGKIHTAPKDTHYTVFSLWDTFRASHPLYTVIDQKRTLDFINTFLRIYEQGGRLPVWELWGEETDTMIGYHAVSVIADAMAKGIKGFDYEKAYQAAKHSAELDHFGLAAYKKRGYISMEDEQESVSKTLEYAYNDWCIMSIASTLFNMRQFDKEKNRGPKYDDKYFEKLAAEIEYYRRRAGSFENLFDTETGFFRPRQNGGFVKPFAPQEVTFHFTEGNSWQYSFFVPHDVSRLMQLMGGSAKFVQKLDELFTTQTKLTGREQPDITGLMGQYAHGNEPSHHIGYLYNYAAAPSKTQKRVRQIMDEFYKPTPDGLIGNEDCGQMSAWYVLSASGFYPVLPGQTRYDLGTPIFKEVTYHLENGKKFTVKAPKVSQANIYVNSAKWNGKTHPFSYVTHEQIVSGGILELGMSNRPNDNAFTSYSVSSVFQDFPAVPVIEGGGRVFNASTLVTLKTAAPGARIHYSLDGSEPGKDSEVYDAPFTINKTTTVKAVSVNQNGSASKAAEATFRKKPNDWTVQIFSKYSRQYSGGGDDGLIDGLRGTTNFASGEWQGYQGQDFIAVIDLKKETEIKQIGGGFLQVARSWIWMPTRIEFEVSSDNVNFREVAEIKTDVPVEDMTPTIRDYVQKISPVRARYVRVKAKNLGKIPAWHPGAGHDAYIFIDEIFLR